jgi:diguanylate cyclase (GGDEF)-like protein
MRGYGPRWTLGVPGGGQVDERVRAARLGGGLLLCEGLTMLATLWLLPPGTDVRSLTGIALVLVAAGAVTPLLPWRRWAPRATAAIAVFQVGLIGLGGPLAHGGMRFYSGFLMLAFVLTGLTQPRWTSVALLLPAGATYVRLNGGLTSGWIVRLVIAIPLWLVIGVLLAGTQARQRQAHGSVQRLFEATRRLAATLDKAETVGLAAELAAELLGADGVDLMVAEQPGGTRYANLGQHGSRLPLGEVVVDVEAEVGGVAGAIRRRHTLFVPDTRGSPLVSPELARASGARSAAFIPLPGESGCPGVIVAVWRSPRRRLDSLTAQAAELLTTEVGRALERVRANAELTLEAETDPLTRLANRRTYDQALARIKAGDAVVLLDLDHFKRINDRHGHAVGDQVLMRFAECLRLAAPRRGDCVARYGGEEFALVLVGAGGPGAAAVLERMHGEWMITDPLSTFSAGVAVHRPGEQAVETVARADAALYRAKQEGRARWILEPLAQAASTDPGGWARHRTGT